MKSVGLITEYNPFHNGHLFHATLSKQRSETNVTIAIMRVFCDAWRTSNLP